MERASISKNRFFFWAAMIALFNPLPAGLILGLVMSAEQDLKREGRIIALFALAWGVVALLLVSRYKQFLLL